MRRRNRRQIKIRLFKVTLLMLVVMTCVLSFSAFSKTDHVEPEDYEEVYVRPGDTLWSIAADYYGTGIDTREAVYEIKKYNDLESGMLSVGQKLLLPVLD